jgi:hypothetical protein
MDSLTQCITPHCRNEALVTSTSQPICDACWAQVVKLVPGLTKWSPTPMERSGPFSVALDQWLEGR